MSNESQLDSKIGAGHAAAMARLGLRELRQAVYTQSNVVQQHAELGLYGTSTPQEVTQQRQEDSREVEPEQGSVLDQRLKEAAEQQQPARDAKEMERD